MSDVLTIQSHKGPYSVRFCTSIFPEISALVAPGVHFIVDRNVGRLYERELSPILAHSSVISIEAVESAKSLEAMPEYVRSLLARKARRGDKLIAIGGGIVQDITCFLAATLFRGMDWIFVPTTLLAQADSCIGSKSSINVGESKNILGTFTPPQKILLSTEFLRTLTERDLCSGIGEMLKVHAIDGRESFDQIACDYESLITEPTVMTRYLHRSLAIKKRFIELDEFDTGPRLVMNYGHSFGHAIESATDFAIPHGVAVTIGMDMANYTAVRLGRLSQADFDRMHPVLTRNARVTSSVGVPLDAFLVALSRDKKNSATELKLILPNADACVERVGVRADESFRKICSDYFLAREAGREPHAS